MTEMTQLDALMEEDEKNRMVMHTAAKNDTLLAIERIENKKEEIDTELMEQQRLAEATERQLEEEAAQWRRQCHSTVSPFQKVGNEFVDHDKMDRKRQGRLAADAIREAARQSIAEWRQGFSAKFAHGKNPSITAASGELVMNN
jgi:hypothetical protein